MTSSTGFISSRPETPSLAEPETAELAQVNIRGMSLDSHDPLETRGGVHRLPDEYGGGYPVDNMQMSTVEKSP